MLIFMYIKALSLNCDSQGAITPAVMRDSGKDRGKPNEDQRCTSEDHNNGVQRNGRSPCV